MFIPHYVVLQFSSYLFHFSLYTRYSARFQIFTALQITIIISWGLCCPNFRAVSDAGSKPFHNFYTYIYIAELILQTLQIQAQVELASLGWCRNSRDYPKSCVSAVTVMEMPMSLFLTYYVPSFEWGSRAVRFAWLALKVDMQNAGDFVAVILLHKSTCRHVSEN